MTLTRPRRALSGAFSWAALLVALLASCALWAVPASAADTATIDNAQPADGAVRLLVSVPGVDDVDLTSVKVTLDGQDTESTAVAAANSNDVQRTSILAIDTSDSMRGARIAEAKKAALAYLAAVPANVKVGVVTFDDRVKVAVPAGLDRAAAQAAIGALTLSHNTALYDGVLGALDAAGPGGAKAGQRKILILSDGKDTTNTPLPGVLEKVRASGVTVDAIALQQGDAGNKPLTDIAAAGKGTVIDTQDPTALSAAFAKEAVDLARQVLVTATVPKGSSALDSNVQVTLKAGASEFTTGAFLRVRTKTEAAVAPTGPVPVAPSRFSIPETVMFGGVGAIGVGLIALIAVLAMGGPSRSQADSLTDQMRAYGVKAEDRVHLPSAPREDLSIADQARQAAERALANNKTLEARIAKRLDGAGMQLKPAEWLLLHGSIALAGGLFGVLIGSGSAFFGLIFIVAGIIGPWIYLGLKRSRRLKAFNMGLADTLQLMSGSLSAGLSLAQSIDTIVREGSEPITSEFRRVTIESRLGVTLEDSLEGVAERMESKDFEWVVMAIRIQREVGGNLAELLLTVAATLRERDYLRRHVRALSAEGRLSAYILGGLPPGFLAYLTLSKPDYVKPMYTTPIGWILCIVMGVLLSVGVFWMSKVAKVDV